MRNRMLFTVSALVLASASTAFGQAQTRTLKSPPAALPMGPVAFPPFVERSLSGGAQVLVVEHHEQPVVSVNIYIRGAGTTSDPEVKPGVAELTANLLRAGTANKSSLQIAQTFDAMGAQTSSNASADWSTFTVTALKADIDAALAQAAEIVMNPTFPAEEFETQRKRTLTNLQVQLSQPAQLASRVFTNRVYGAHPYGRLTTTTSLRGVTRDDLVNFHSTHYKPGNALVVIAGDVNPNDIIARFEKAFSGWTGRGPARPKFATAPVANTREIILVNKPGAVQAAFRIGHTIVPATHADWPALVVAQEILGGGSKGWLFETLREKKGFTYGAYAQSAMRLDPGHFQMWGDVRNEVADSALQLFIELAQQIKDKPVPAADLELAKAQLTGSFPLSIETPSQIAGQVATAMLVGQPKTHVQTWRQRLAAVTAADVQRVARAHFRPENSIIVISGDANVLHPKLEKFAKITLVDEEGRPVAAADAAPKAMSMKFDASGIKPMMATYAVIAQGNPIAEVTRTVTRQTVGGKDVIKATSVTTGMISGNGELIFEAKTLTPVSSNVSMQMGPQTMTQNLTFANGKITGKVSGPPQGDKDVNLDATAGTMLAGMDEFAYMVTDFGTTKNVSIPVFVAQTGSISPFSAKVTGESKVTVPAGTFDVYELDTVGAQGPARMYVTKAAPHMMVKLELQAQPVVFELKSMK